MDHRSLSRQAKADHSSRIASRRGESPSDAAADKAMITRAFAQHDKQLHGGKPTRLHLKDGGSAEGSANGSRLDRPGRARGGKMSKGKGNHVNVIVASGGGQDRPVPVPVPAAGPPHPPMMPPPGAGAPPMGPGGPPMGMPPGAGGPPMMPPRPPMAGGMPMRADGGKTVAVHMDAGAAGGKGRLEKSKMAIPDENAAD